MSSTATALIVFGCVFGGALLGMLLRRVLPEHHLSSESKDVAKLATGLVGTMAALVLGLLVSSAKGSYDAQSTELTQLSSNVVLLDRILAHYGPEVNDVRAGLRSFVSQALDQMWSSERTNPSASAPSGAGEVIYDRLRGLAPKDEMQREAKGQALSVAMSVGQTRWLMFEQRATSISLPLLVMLVLWLTFIFVSFGLFAPANGTVVASLGFAALSVSGAVFLILEMYTPYAGLIQISSAPLRAALAHLGQ